MPGLRSPALHLATVRGVRDSLLLRGCVPSAPSAVVAGADEGFEHETVNTLTRSARQGDRVVLLTGRSGKQRTQQTWRLVYTKLATDLAEVRDRVPPVARDWMPLFFHPVISA